MIIVLYMYTYVLYVYYIYIYTLYIYCIYNTHTIYICIYTLYIYIHYIYICEFCQCPVFHSIVHLRGVSGCSRIFRTYVAQVHGCCRKTAAGTPFALVRWVKEPFVCPGDLLDLLGRQRTVYW